MSGQSPWDGPLPPVVDEHRPEVPAEPNHARQSVATAVIRQYAEGNVDLVRVLRRLLDDGYEIPTLTSPADAPPLEVANELLDYVLPANGFPAGSTRILGPARHAPDLIVPGANGPIPGDRPVAAAGGACPPAPDMFDFFKLPEPPVIPADPVELIAYWRNEAANWRQAARRLKGSKHKSDRNRRRRYKAMASQLDACARELEKCLAGGGPMTLLDYWTPLSPTWGGIKFIQPPPLDPEP